MSNERRNGSRIRGLLAQWDRTFRWALAASVLFHLLIVLLFRAERLVPVMRTAAAGEQAGDPVAAAGGGMEMIEYRIETPPPEPEPVVPTPEPVPVPEPEPEPAPQEPSAEPNQGQTQQQSSGAGRGPETGPGTATGTGRGDGGTADEGLNRVVAPTPRGMILPPSDRPSRVKGMTVTVYVFVAASGNVVADSTRISPPTGDSRFDRRLRDDAAQWKFRPATRGGQPIAAWFPYTITF
ncbi:MAG TPA: energy transducer TonB [Longimicrobiales bacterium]